MTWIALLYLVGALLALWRTDAAWPIRLVLALAWPIGPAAFVLTVALLLAASSIAFPVVAAVLAAGAVAWWVFA